MSDDILRCDMHTHTGFSDDCDVPMADMLAAAYSSGIELSLIHISEPTRH